MTLHLPEIIALSALAAALGILMALSVIDLRVELLPNKLVLGFAAAGAAFHYASHFLFVSPIEMLEGAALGGGFLYAVRVAANFYYKKDALGLGDVKLLAAAGLWLGPQGVITAIMAGATAGIVHGLGAALYERFKTGRPINLNTLSLPAGPGFAVGIVIAGAIKFWDLPYILMP